MGGHIEVPAPDTVFDLRKKMTCLHVYHDHVINWRSFGGARDGCPSRLLLCINIMFS
jgi:hypothetical protein